MGLSPAILTFGEDHIADYSVTKYHASMRRAFLTKGSDFITLDSNPHGQRFLAACAAYAVRNGYLECDRIDTGEQEEVASFRITAAGRRWLNCAGCTEERIHTELEIFAHHPEAFGSTPVPLETGTTEESIRKD